MTAPFKLLVSIAVAALAAVVWTSRTKLNPDIPIWLVPTLTALMVLAVWLFPDTKRK